MRVRRQGWEGESEKARVGARVRVRRQGWEGEGESEKARVGG